MARTVIDLDARASVLEASEGIASAPPDDDIALVVAPGAPVLRNAVFLEVLRAQAGIRRLSLVTTDARARSLASSGHVPAYASVAALERHELDPTERLTAARRAAIAKGRAAPRTAPSVRRVAAIAASLTGAALILAAVILPEARVVVAPAVSALGPVDMTIRAGGSGDIAARTLTGQISAKVSGTASGERIEEKRATGSVRLSNRTTDDQTVPKGTIFKTVDGIQFLSTADAKLPRSLIVPPVELFVGRVDVAVEAAIAGEAGNVGAGRITIGPRPDRFDVTNPQPATGGSLTHIPVIKIEDYNAAVARAPESLRTAGDTQLARWVQDPRPGEQVVRQVAVKQTSVAPASVDVVGKESSTFELTVSGIATAYAVAEGEPARAAVAKLSASVSPGNEVDTRSTTVDVKSVAAGDDGVTWQISARGAQLTHFDRQRIQRLLAGRLAGDAGAVVQSERLTLKRVVRTPGWWPLLPILDARITVELETPAATTPP